MMLGGSSPSAAAFTTRLLWPLPYFDAGARCSPKSMSAFSMNGTRASMDAAIVILSLAASSTRR